MDYKHEIVHAGLVSFGVLLLLYIWQVPMGQQMGYFMQPETLLPVFAFLTIGVLLWDKVIHGYVLKLLK